MPSDSSQKLQTAYNLIYIFGQIFFSLALLFSLASIVYIFSSLKRKDRTQQTILKPEIILIFSLWVLADLGFLIMNNIEKEIDNRMMTCNQCITADCEACQSPQFGVILGYCIGVFLSKLVFLTFWKVACIYGTTAIGLKVDRKRETSLEELATKKERQQRRNKIIEVTVVIAIVLLDCLYTLCIVEWYVVGRANAKYYAWKACSLFL